jgi:hypothetical protein
MDALAQIDMVVELLERLGVEVRRERMGGSGGGLCRMRGRQVMFLDEDADAATRLERCAAGLAMMPESESVFLPPELRERVERMRADRH